MTWVSNLISVFRDAGWKGWLLLAVICVHVLWICFHLNAVANKRFNPWKLGGYGMYTIPPPSTQLSVFDLSFGRKQIPRDQYERNGFREKNYRFSIRCLPPSKESIQAFFDENPSLAKKSLEFAIHERIFKRYPMSWEREEITNLKLYWRKDFKYLLEGTVCGNPYKRIDSYEPLTYDDSKDLEKRQAE